MAEIVFRVGNRHAPLASVFAAELQRLVEGARQLGHVHPILRALRPGQRRPHRAQVETQRAGVDGLRFAIAPQALRLRVRLHQRHGLRRTTAQREIADRLVVHGEEAAGGPVFRGHVGDGGAVRQRQVREAGAKELHELAHHAVRAQHLHYAQHEIRGGHAFRQRAGELETHHLGNEHGDRLPQHGRFRFDAAHAPAQHAEAVHHGGVAVRAH